MRGVVPFRLKVLEGPGDLRELFEAELELFTLMPLFPLRLKSPMVGDRIDLVIYLVEE